MGVDLLTSSLGPSEMMPSNSFGLRIRLIDSATPGSLYIGGYDEMRVLGTLAAVHCTSIPLRIDLVDVAIGVAEEKYSFQAAGCRSGYRSVTP